MKLISTSCVALVFLTGCATFQRMDGSKLTNLSFSDAQADPGKWEEFGKQISAGKAVVVKIEAGQQVPLKLTMGLPMADVVTGESQLLFTCDTYLYISTATIKVSPDEQRWAEIQDLKSLKKLFGSKKGELLIGLRATKEEGPRISISVH